MTKARVHPVEIARLAVIALFFLAAPTAGDIGSCSQRTDDLDPARFCEAKQNLDCLRCEQCKLKSQYCTRACGQSLPVAFPDDVRQHCYAQVVDAGKVAFPVNCYPVVHDGEVCLDALKAASCSDDQSFTADQGSNIPTECLFCPPRPDGGS